MTQLKLAECFADWLLENAHPDADEWLYFQDSKTYTSEQMLKKFLLFIKTVKLEN